MDQLAVAAYDGFAKFPDSRVFSGFFITFEGGEGAGKSTQIARLADRLRARDHEVVTTREPGGSPGAEAVRHVLLSGAAEPFGPVMEAILFAAARSDHVEQVIRPAVRRGAVVLCDRFLDSSRVYQGTATGLEPAFMVALERVAINGMMPHLTLILDLDPVEGLRRAAERRSGEGPDRFEKETIALHQQRREAYLAIAAAEPERCIVIDASGDADQVARVIEAAAFAALDSLKRSEVAEKERTKAVAVVAVADPVASDVVAETVASEALPEAAIAETAQSDAVAAEGDKAEDRPADAEGASTELSATEVSPSEEVPIVGEAEQIEPSSAETGPAMPAATEESQLKEAPVPALPTQVEEAVAEASPMEAPTPEASQPVASDVGEERAVESVSVADEVVPSPPPVAMPTTTEADKAFEAAIHAVEEVTQAVAKPGHKKDDDAFDAAIHAIEDAAHAVVAAVQAAEGKAKKPASEGEGKPTARESVG